MSTVCVCFVLISLNFKKVTFCIIRLAKPFSSMFNILFSTKGSIVLSPLSIPVQRTYQDILNLSYISINVDSRETKTVGHELEIINEHIRGL